MNVIRRYLLDKEVAGTSTLPSKDEGIYNRWDVFMNVLGA